MRILLARLDDIVASEGLPLFPFDPLELEWNPFADKMLPEMGLGLSVVREDLHTILKLLWLLVEEEKSDLRGLFWLGYGLLRLGLLGGLRSLVLMLVVALNAVVVFFLLSSVAILEYLTLSALSSDYPFCLISLISLSLHCSRQCILSL
jgi:hypothetical protein